MPDSGRLQQAMFAGGCFWCTEAVFRRLCGVDSVVSGYIGGDGLRPTYEQVCTGATGHAEAVQISFDPAVISYCDLLDVFFQTHDPTTLNRQGNDVGTQYRSAVFYLDDSQRRAAEDAIRELDGSGRYPLPIVTQVVPSGEFYPAETYHQEYFDRNPSQSYCRLVISPKLEKFNKTFATKLKDSG